MNKKTLLAVQISAIILFSSVLGGMFYFTDIYDDVESGIVRVLCLSCIKLQPVTSKEFTFDTANGEPHPDFVTDSLKTKGPVLIQYGYNGCDACHLMIKNVMKDFFNIKFIEVGEWPDKLFKSFETEVNVGNLSFYYIYINIDDDNTPTSRKDSYPIYDKDHIGGFPMFTIITLEYTHGGDIKPYYASLYGANFEDSYKKMYETFIELLEFSSESYDRNIAGFK